MLIDDATKLRKALLKLIPIPKNEEVVYYDNRFIELINIDVDRLYNDELEKYKELQSQYKSVKAKIDDFNERISNLSVIDKKMSENEYVSEIQALEIEYAKKYRDIKVLDNKINIYRNKILDLDNKIEIQKAKEMNALKQKKENIFDEKEKIKTNLSNMRMILNLKQKMIDFVLEKIEAKQKQYFYVEKYGESILNNTYTCEYCKGHIHSKKTKDALLQENEGDKQVILNEINKLNNELETLNMDKAELVYNMTKAKDEYKNWEKIDSQELFRYDKKSIEVLKLEASKFDIQNKLQEIQEQQIEKSKQYGVEFANLKNKINSYKESLLNIHQLKEDKEELQEDLKLYDEIIEQAKQLKLEMQLHFDFIATRNKLIEQKLCNLFDNSLKFELFDKNGIEFIEKCVLYYNNIEQRYLTPTEQKQINKMIKDKIVLLNKT